uniref:NADH dehydrogenase subunit 5 n=1 Tax=Amblyomma dissimile TaxID=251381 RepID=UPI002E79CAF3|nr:NADH dehydrogenase subunit 5 [Amblyomma dissimile]WQF68960.1 NADH dehydrogenase subunit 5 [Amblyomma dissimile]
MFIYWSLMLMTMSFFFMIMLMYILITQNLFIFEYNLITIQNLDVKLYFMFDWISMLFVMIVLLISSMVILYSNEYMSQDKNKNSFCYIVLLFVMSMIMLILMPNMLMIILGWDGLGLVSYCLVIYYQSINSYNSGMMTIISNRVGDVMIILSLIFFVSFGSFDFLSFQKFELICGILILTAGLTKSAQIPFSAWLPAAMAAPTPVSSLVHSSTLVTAGVYLLLRFHYLWNVKFFSKILMKIALLTMLMSGINAFFENDFKKIIAFSTLSQLSLMMISIALNMIDMAFFHLIMHAIFKSMLFLCAGLIIHSFQGIQDVRMLGNFFFVSPLISSCMLISTFSLMGLPFLGGFYSKDLIMEFFFFKINNLVLILIFLIGILFTFLYCSRLIYFFMIKGQMNLSMMNFKFNFFMTTPIFILCFLVIILGSLMNWMTNSNFNLIFISNLNKYFSFFLLIFSIFLFFTFKNIKFKSDFFYNIWHLSFLTSYIFLKSNKMMIKISLSDWTWMEVLGPLNLKNNFYLIYNYNFWIEKKNFNKILLILFTFLILILI